MIKNIFFLGFTCILLASCGVKPSSVDAPSGSEGVEYPRTYPAPTYSTPETIRRDPQEI